jgi:hypothetical protein
MARYTGPRTVQCYHCRHRFEVGGRAQSTSCPGCYKPVIVENLVVDKLKLVTEVRTCGHITVTRKGRIGAKLVEAHLGITCEGTIDAKEIRGGLHLHLGSKCHFKGDAKALALTIEEGAIISPSFFDVPNDELGLSTLPIEGAAPPSG